MSEKVMGNCPMGCGDTLGQLEPAQAREIAANLFEAAARAEYEADFARTATAGGLDGETLGQILLMIRNGEERRHA